MAYLQQNNQNDPNNPNNQSGGPSNAGSPTSLTSGGSGVSAGGTPSQSNGSNQGNQFSNLQKLMNLNQNAPNTASKINQNVQQGQQTQQNNISQATQGIGQAFNYNQGDMSNKIQNNDFSGLKQQLDTTYKGPQAGTIEVGPQNLNQINQQTNALGSKGGQQALLAQQYGRNDYTSGQQRLDNFLQGRNNQFQQDAAQARNQGKQLNQSTANQNQALNQKAATTSQQTQQGVSNLKQGLGTTVQGYQTDAEKAADAANAADQQTQLKVNSAKTAIAGGNTDANTLQQLGFDPNAYTYGVNLGNFIGYQGGQATTNNIMSGDTYNKFKNINGLLNNDMSGYQDDLAGTYKQGQETFDKTGLQSALAQGQQSYNNALAPQQQSLDSANDINRLVQQRDKSPIGTPAWYAAQQEIAQKYPGAVNNGFTRNDWASGLQQSAQKAYDEQKQLEDSQYLKKIGVSNG